MFFSFEDAFFLMKFVYELESERKFRVFLVFSVDLKRSLRGKKLKELKNPKAVN